MAFLQPFQNSPTITSTEYSCVTAGTTLATVSTSIGIFTFVADFSALTAADSYRVRIYEKANNASSKRILHETTLTGVQSEPIFMSPSLYLCFGWDITLTKIAGTDRVINYSIRQVS